jgi:hypothetical protein
LSRHAAFSTTCEPAEIVALTGGTAFNTTVSGGNLLVLFGGLADLRLSITSL